MIALAGHTPGSIALFWEDADGQGHLFTGDSLFPGGVGNTFGDADAFATLIDEVSTKIFDVYGDDVWFYPGHGGDSTLGAERAAPRRVARAGLVSLAPARLPDVRQARRWSRRSGAGAASADSSVAVRIGFRVKSPA